MMVPAVIAASVLVLVWFTWPLLCTLSGLAVAFLVTAAALTLVFSFFSFLFGWIIHPVYPPEPWLTLSVVAIFAVGALGIPYAFLSPTSEWRNRKRRP